MAPTSPRGGVLPRVATPAMPHMTARSDPQPLAQLHADLIAHEAQGRRPSMHKFVAFCLGVLLLGIVLRSAVWVHDAAHDTSRNWFVED
ncbi:MAG: hypothetical protein HIU85_15790, partial [Proteobacteria bacterium]|nr:hypothetical protein [Pseudomonadota bacterium]